MPAKTFDRVRDHLESDATDIYSAKQPYGIVAVRWF